MTKGLCLNTASSGPEINNRIMNMNTPSIVNVTLWQHIYIYIYIYVAPNGYINISIYLHQMRLLLTDLTKKDTPDKISLNPTSDRHSPTSN